MYWDVVEVKSLEGMSLFVRFADGVTGEVRFAPERREALRPPDSQLRLAVFEQAMALRVCRFYRQSNRHRPLYTLS